MCLTFMLFILKTCKASLNSEKFTDIPSKLCHDQKKDSDDVFASLKIDQDSLCKFSNNTLYNNNTSYDVRNIIVVEFLKLSLIVHILRS